MKSVTGFMRLIALACATLSLLSGSALAQQGGGGGGGSSSGGGSAVGGGGVLTTLAITMNNSAHPFQGVLPQGAATFTYTKNGLPQSLDIQVSHVNLPDGAVVKVRATDALRVTGRCWHYEYYSYAMTITGGKGSLSFSAGKGDVVPFLDPKKGFTQIDLSPDFATSPSVLTGLLPFKGIL